MRILLIVLGLAGCGADHQHVVVADGQPVTVDLQAGDRLDITGLDQTGCDHAGGRLLNGTCINVDF